MIWSVREHPEKRRRVLAALAATAACSLMAHGFLFSNEFFSHDSVSYFTYSTGTPSFYLSIGRFLIPLYEQIKGDVAAPWLIGVLYVLWLTAAALAAAKLLEIRSGGGLALTCALLSTSTALTLTGATYVYCMDEYAFALLCAVGSAYLLGRRDWRARLGGGLLLMASLAVYQAYFTAAAALCFLAVLRRTAAGEPLGRVVREGVTELALLAGSFLVYYGLWQGLCRAFGVSPRRVEESLLGGGGVPALLREANVRYVTGLFDTGGVLGGLLAAVHGLLVLGLLFCLVSVLRRRELPAGNKVLLVVLVCLIPTAFNSVWVLMNGEATGLMTFAGELLYLLAAACREPDRGRPVLWRTGAAVLLCLVVWQHVVFANQVYMKKELEKNTTLVLAGQVIGRIEAAEGYVPGQTPVAFAGRLDYNAVWTRDRAAFRDLDGAVGLRSGISATYNLGRYLTDYLYYPLVWDETVDAAALPGVAEMPVFPAQGSTAMIDGVLVVKLSES